MSAQEAKFRLQFALAMDRTKLRPNTHLYYKGSGPIVFDPPLTLDVNQTIITEYTCGADGLVVDWEAAIVEECEK